MQHNDLNSDVIRLMQLNEARTYCCHAPNGIPFDEVIKSIFMEINEIRNRIRSFADGKSYETYVSNEDTLEALLAYQNAIADVLMEGGVLTPENGDMNSWWQKIIDAQVQGAQVIRNIKKHKIDI